MTTHPETAMTREQVLDALSKYDKAVDWRKYNQGSMDRLNDVLDAAKTLADAVRALASTRQEPAPAADAEEVASECIKDWEKISAPVYNRDLLIAAITAALRRYAGDGGVTWQPIETAPKDGTHILAVNADEPFPPSTVHYFNEGDGTGGWCLSVVAKEEEFYRTPTDWMSLPAAPAARAKSGEKGGAR